MTPDEIREVFDGFIEYPEGSEKLYVTTASTLIFAHHIAKIAAERERDACAKVCDEETLIRTKAGQSHPEESDSRGRCFAAARAAINCASAIRARSTP